MYAYVFLGPIMFNILSSFYNAYLISYFANFYRLTTLSEFDI